MKLSDFSKARVGDTVWDVKWGDGKILTIDSKTSDDGFKLPLIVGFTHNFTAIFSLDGRQGVGELFSRLFWAKVRFPETPSPPKRKVKVARWMNVFRHGSVNGELYSSETLFLDKDTAAEDMETNEDYIGTIPIEIEVEE